MLNMKTSVLWMNIGEIAVILGILNHSFYKCAHLYDSCRHTPSHPVLFA